jgi:hypothetical protein
LSVPEIEARMPVWAFPFSMSDPFASAHRKIARAKEHLNNLSKEIRAFIDSGAYEQVVEDDTDRPGYTFHKIRLTKTIPRSIEHIAGDVITNLRSALDHACFGVAMASGNPDPRYAYFPFARNVEGLENAIKGYCKDVPKEIYPLFRSL